jgi:hypothetical protein
MATNLEVKKMTVEYLAAALLVLGGIGATTVPAQPAAASGTGCGTPVVQPTGPFSIENDNRTVADRNGHAFVSYGTTVPGLASPAFSSDPNFVKDVVDGKDIPKIDATSAVWCGNTARLQVSQYDVTPDGSTCDASFLSKALDAEVREAEADGMVAVINDTTESDPAANTEKDPTTATFTFWNCVAHHTESWPGGLAYGQDPEVIFDVFNEPRADACTSPDGPYDMNLWRNGGTYTGCGQTNVKYQGMDAVVYHLRQDGAQNLLWAEGPGTGNTLAGLTPSGGPSYLITDSLHRVVYSIHHPYASATVPADSATWWNEFGYLIDHPAAAGVAPVVAGEWTNVTAAVQDNPYCWLDAPTSVPEFLSYLQKLGVGMSAYQLASGYLLKANGSPWTDTTNYTDAPWKSGYCTYSSGQRPPLLGAGADIRAWFQARD